MNNFEELEMITDSVHLALAEKELEDCTRPEMTAEWKRLPSKGCTDASTAYAVANFFPRRCCDEHKKHDKEEAGLFKKEFTCTEMLCLCSKRYCSYVVTTNKYKFSSKGLNKRVLEQSVVGNLDKYHRVSDEKNITSTDRAFRANNHAVTTYEQIKKSFC